MISVLVPSCRSEFLHALLLSMERCQPHSTVQVIVGDSGLNRRFIDVPVQVDIPEPFVFAKAINRLVDAAPSENDLLVLNDDTEILTPEWLWGIETFMTSWHRWWATRWVTRRHGLISLGIEGRAGNPEQTQPTYGLVQETRQSICFVATLIPRRVWREIGPLDERYVGYGHEDDDYCVRVWRAGYKTAVWDGVKVRHDKGPGVGTFAETLKGQAWEDAYDLNARLFAEKWGVTFTGRKGLSNASDHVPSIRP